MEARWSFVLRPRDRSGSLPEWQPATPSGGWTPSTVLAAAETYADSVVLDLPSSRVVGAAYRDLMSALPAVKRAEILDRMRGFATLPAASAHDPSTIDDPAPF